MGKFLEDIISSTAGSILAGVATTPLEVLKIRKQNFATTCGASSLSYFRQLIQTEGHSTLFSGLMPTLFMTVPATVTYFVLYERLKVVYGFRPEDKRTTYRAALAGTSARLTAIVLVSPLELIKTLQQSGKVTFPKLKNIFVNAAKRYGYTGVITRGLGLTILREIPQSFTLWFLYEKFKQIGVKYYPQSTNDCKKVILLNSISSALAGTIAATVSYPIDVMKTMTQVSLKNNRMRTTAYDELKKAAYKRGLRVIFSGLGPRLLKVVPTVVIMITTFEVIKNAYSKK